VISTTGVAAARGQPRVDVRVQGGDGGRVQVLVVDQEDVVVRVPAVVIALGELQGEDVTGDAEASLQALPGSSSADLFQAARSASTSLLSGSPRSCGTVMVTSVAARPSASSHVVRASRSSAARRW
jgi:hypothetical protein